MNDLFQHVASGFTVDWDPDELTKNFPTVSEGDKIVIMQDGTPHWQHYPSNVSFSRNFHKAFPAHCIQVAKYLQELKETLRDMPDKSWMVETFLNTPLDPKRVLLIKVPCATDVSLHFDITRIFSINIGLKNSNLCQTHIYSGDKVRDTLISDKSVKYTYLMNDGDVYFLHTWQPHSVESLAKDKPDTSRYLFSYSFDPPKKS